MWEILHRRFSVQAGESPSPQRDLGEILVIFPKSRGGESMKVNEIYTKNKKVFAAMRKVWKDLPDFETIEKIRNLHEVDWECIECHTFKNGVSTYFDFEVEYRPQSKYNKLYIYVDELDLNNEDHMSVTIEYDGKYIKIEFSPASYVEAGEILANLINGHIDEVEIHKYTVHEELKEVWIKCDNDITYTSPPFMVVKGMIKYKFLKYIGKHKIFEAVFTSRRRRYLRMENDIRTQKIEEWRLIANFFNIFDRIERSS